MNKQNENFSGVTLKPEPVVAVTVVCQLGNERQINLAAHFNRDDEPEEQNRILDQVMRIADRQKAKYDLKTLEENFNIVGLNTRNFLMAYAGAGLELKTRIAKLKIELDAKEEARKEVHDAAYAEFRAAGRSGTFRPKGHDLQRMNLADSEIANLRAAIEAAPKDAEQEKAKSVNTIQRNQEDLRLRRKVINDLRSLAGLSPNEEFMDAETAEV